MTDDITARVQRALEDVTRAVEAWRESRTTDDSFQYHVVECAENLTSGVPALLAEVERLRTALCDVAIDQYRREKGMTL